ncbi:MAG: penicillin-binding protein 1C, partial [Rhodospirillaceae bacterium]|nr:penicillin-binding protein 1C [Rhodospirillaceae bacterium]
PGSALKPFIYGMAFDELVVHPDTIMIDQPMRFGDWAPENFDHLFRGEISAREALQLSLNLPAVTLMDAIGAPPFAQKLTDAGFPLHLPKDAGRPGLPIALGGVGVTLEQLVALYASFAEEGQVRALSYLANTPQAEVKPFIGARGSYYVTRILEDTPPPAAWLASGNRRQASRIAYKTGTSYGYRDAWAVGYTKDYTIGIWVGRPDGSFSGGRMGRDAAAPLLFEVFDQLPPSESALAPVPPAGVLLTVPVAESNPILPLVLKAEGGNLPLRWLVNGKPVSSPPYLRQAQWDPDGKGAQRVTVIDAGGRSASAEIWLK